MMASDNAIRVTCAGSNSGRPSSVANFSVSEPPSVTNGIASAGTNRRFLNPRASARRSFKLVVLGCPSPNPAKPASAAMASTSTPLPRSPKKSPNRKLAANRPQKSAFTVRFGLARSAAEKIAIAPNTIPAKT